MHRQKRKPPAMPFINRLLSWARTDPGRPAVVAAEHSLTYGELAALATRVPLPDGAMIGLDLHDPVDFAVALVAVVGRGRCAAVLDPLWDNARRAHVLERLRPDAVVSSVPPVNGSAVSRLQDGPDKARFYCGFTSGTTGVPKAFVRTVGSWTRSLERSVTYFGLEEGQRVFAPGPLSASLSLYALAESLFAGATFHALVPGRDSLKGAHICEVLRSARIEHLVGVPAVLRLALQRTGDSSLPDLRCVVSGGAKLSGAETAIIRRSAPNARIFEYYGASELSLVTARQVGTDPRNDVGQPFPGVSIKIETDGVDRCGTVWVHTDTAMEGYLFGDDGAEFRRHGSWVSVGDKGWLDDDGALHLVGRQGDMVVVAGTNVYPSEVEEELRAAGFPLVVAVGIPDPRRGTAIAAVVEVAAGVVIDARRIQQRLRTVLPAAKVPREIYRTDCMPLTAAGKPDRVVARSLILDPDGALERL